MTAVTRAASISAVAALVLAAVWFLWPVSLGGGTTFLATHGTSMEPGFDSGDLAILRPDDAYSVGDVVAYRSAALDTIVMHRIIDRDGDRFLVRGDNNDWLDEERPSQDEILGRLFLRVPQGGKVLDALGSPGVLPFSGAAAFALLGAAAHRPRGRHGRRSAGRRHSPAFSMPIRARARQISLVSAAVALLAAAGFGVLVASPGTQTDTRTVAVTQQGTFSYSGAAAPGTTYPTGVIATGDTVWTRLASGLTVSFTNTVSGPDLADLRGALRLDVVVAAADGWSAVLTSGPAATLREGTATASVVVDPRGATDLLTRHFAEIGTSGGGATLTVTPVAETTGTVQGQTFTAGSPAGLAFTIDAAFLRPAGNAAGLAPSTRTAVQVEEIVPRRFAVLSLAVPIDIARFAAAGILALALVTLGAGAWIGRSDRKDVADQFLVRHADRIVPVASITPGPSVVDVADAESLHRVAERFDTLVLHHAAPDEDVFVVRDVEMTYRFVVPGTPERQRGKPPVPAAATAPAPAPAYEPVPADMTGPLPMVVPVPVSVSGGLWGRLA
jgi:signal peptidase I